MILDIHKIDSNLLFNTFPQTPGRGGSFIKHIFERWREIVDW